MDFSVRKIIFPHTFINKGVWRKKSKCIENGHYPVEKTRKIQEIIIMFLFLSIAEVILRIKFA